ncbi:MAG TPA: MASE1 domain-containing protein [Pyrinomonadaceae bacterium]|nr:MASE1 domain-containing protein [Pyrinomonadaceae bacterium]
MKRSLIPPIGLSLIVAIVYFAAAELGLSVASLHQNVTPVWPPTGIAIASLLIFGRRVWPGVFLGALAANLPTNIPIASAFGIATGNTLEALLACWLLQRTPRWRKSFESVGDVMIFVVYAAVLAPVVGATIGSLSLCFGDPREWGRFSWLWLTWWMGDGFGALIVSPLLLSWSSGRRFSSRDQAEIASLFVLLVIVVLIVFAGWFPGPVKTYPLAYLSLPCLLWAALKFDQRIVTTAIVLMAGLAVWGARHGYGPFAQPNPNASLLLLISFVGTATLMTLIVAAVTSERRKAETDRSKLGSELELHRRRIEDIVAHVPGVVWEAWGSPDAGNQRLDFVSGHIEEMLGYSEQEWLSTPNFWLSIVHPEDRERAAAEAAAIFASGKGGTVRFRLMHKDGREIWVETRSIVVCDESGPIGMRGVTMDITPAVKIETERAELLRLESHARQQAEDASRMKEEFLATVSHELRTPLNAVLGWSRLLRSGQLDQDGMSHAIEVIERNAASQKQIIEDLLDVSRIVAGKLRINTQPVDVLLVIHAAIDAVRPAAEAKQINISTHFEAPDAIVRADTERLQQVLWNLLANAVKFTPVGGAVDVYLEQHDATAEIRIEDSGPGVPPEFLPHIFERFSQADGSSTRQHGGLGLGLAIVRHLVELHGGTVSASNRESGGAVLTVRLPALIDTPDLHGPTPRRTSIRINP